MKSKIDQFSVDLNPMLNVARDGTVLYSNEASEPLLQEWGAEIGEKLPSSIVDIAQSVISRNSPEKIEVKVGNKLYLVVFSPLPEEQYVNISGFDISDQKESEKGMVSEAREKAERDTPVEELRKSEEEYRHSVEYVPTGIYEIDYNGPRFKRVNNAMCKILGYTREELIAKNPLDLMDPESWVRFQDRIRRVLAGEPVDESVAFRVFTKDGRAIWIELNVKLQYKDGKLDDALVVAHDITKCKQAEEALAFQASLLSHSHDAVTVANENYIITHWNKAAEKLFGWAAEEVIGKSSKDIFQTKVPSSSKKEAIEKMLRDNEYDGEVFYKRKDGTYICTHVRTTVLQGLQGEFKGTISVFHDFTECKQAEEALRESEEKYRSIFDSVDEGFCIIEMIFDAEGKPVDYLFLETNRAFKRQTGMHDAIGKRMREFVPNHEEHWFEIYGAIAKTGEPRRFTQTAKPLIGGWYDVYAFPYGGPNSNKVAILFNDITERKRAEKALRESEEKFRVALRSSPTAVFQQDLNLRYTWVYQPHPHFTPEGLLGKRDEDVLDPQDAAPIIALKQRALAEQRPLQGDVVIWVNGNPFYYTLSIEPLYDTRGMLIGISGASTDITERKRAEEALRESEAKYHGLFDSMAEAFELMELIYKNGKPVDYIFLDVNPAWERMTGLKKEQVLGRKASEAVGSVESYWPEAMDRALKTGEIIQIENYGVALDKWYSVNMWKFSETACGVTITDMTESKKAEEALRIANETLEKRVQERTSELEQAYKFLKKIETIRNQEIHHRVKNNLQVISSLLDLQAEKFDNKECIKDSEVMEAFKESQNRVISMALIHEEFHKGGGTDTLNFSQYIKNLADNLFLTYKFGSDGIILDMDIEENIFFDMDTSIPLGMIINELVSNSLKHAFSGREKGEIKIKLHREERKECIESISEDCKSTNFTLTISDNGVGILEELDIEDLNSLGFQLVISLVDQLDGEFELKRNNGTEFTMRFTVTEKDDPTQVDLKSQECSN
ncbi:PAS domain S-box protein [Methanosarcina sp.]|uniref:PAS domain S-box protein n=1 Tax=Methanosarcina sp. TaxID=2213 RepID=UPI0029890EB9|nr:PAS domain S-box protein [Methanosarcina sp.]MDW5559913.1 PAS domain S-box protein [Methanosarcina sp.]